MKKSAKACAIALSLAIAASFTACSEAPANEGGGVDITEDGTTLAENSAETTTTIAETTTTAAETTTTAAETTTTAAETTTTAAETTTTAAETTTTAAETTTTAAETTTTAAETTAEAPPKETAPADTSAQDLEISAYTSVYTGPPDADMQPAPGGANPPIKYDGKNYMWNFISGDYTIDENKNVTADLRDFGKWELDPDDKIDAMMMNFKNLDYLGKVTNKELGLSSSDEFDVYQYDENNLLFVHKSDLMTICSMDFRLHYFGFELFTYEEHKRMEEGAPLKEILADRGIDYDPDLFYEVLLYEIDEEGIVDAVWGRAEEKNELKVKYFDGDSLYGSGGARAPVEYKGVIYEWPFITGYYTIDKDKNVTSDLLDFDKWELDPNDKLDAMMMNFKELEYLGSATGCDVYQYDEDNLLFVANSEFLQMYSFDFREKYFGMSFEESAKIGNDHETLKEYLAENGIEYDPTLFYEVLLYEKTVRDENGVVVTETEEAATVPALSWETADE